MVPISYFASKSELDVLIESLNGFLFPGGSAELPVAAQYVFDEILRYNQEGDFIPLWGTCLGMEWILQAATRDRNVLDRVLVENLSLPLQFTSEARHSKLFSSAPSSLMHILTAENITMNNHQYGIYLDSFRSNRVLNSFFKVLSTSSDTFGRKFVSTIEAAGYPIYGVQWHPEKNIFEYVSAATLSQHSLPKYALNMLLLATCQSFCSFICQ